MRFTSPLFSTVAAAAVLALTPAAASAVSTYGLQVLGAQLAGTGPAVTVYPSFVNQAGMVVGQATVYSQGINLGLQGFVTDVGGLNLRQLVPAEWAPGGAYPFTMVAGLNNAGQVLATTTVSMNGLPVSSSFVWTAGGGPVALQATAMPNIGMPGGEFGGAVSGQIALASYQALNDRGQVAGSLMATTQFGAPSVLPVVWSGSTGQATTLGLQDALGQGGSSGAVITLNNTGLAAGLVLQPSGFGQQVERPAIWNLDSGALRLLPDLASLLPPTPFGGVHAAYNGRLLALNDAGQSLGVFTDAQSQQQRFFLWDNAASQFSLVPITGNGGAVFMNAQGSVVFNDGNAGTAAVWSAADSSVTSLGGRTQVQAVAINAGGQVVGNGFGGGIANNSAMLWEAGTATDLNSVVTLPAGWRLTQATAINDRGQITGIVKTPGGDLGFLLSPTGTAPSAPLLPVVELPIGTGAGAAAGGGDAGFGFVATVEPEQPLFIDPYVAVGYEYLVLSGPSMSAVLLPAGIGDGLYSLHTWDGSAYQDAGVSLVGGTTYRFDTPMTRFVIRGIETSAMLDPADGNAFVTGLSFSGGGQVNVAQLPISEFTAAVPEPGQAWLLALGLGLLSLARRRASWLSA